MSCLFFCGGTSVLDKEIDDSALMQFRALEIGGLVASV